MPRCLLKHSPAKKSRNREKTRKSKENQTKKTKILNENQISEGLKLRKRGGFNHCDLKVVIQEKCLIDFKCNKRKKMLQKFIFISLTILSLISVTLADKPPFPVPNLASKKEKQKAEKLPPCKSCKNLAQSFTKVLTY